MNWERQTLVGVHPVFGLEFGADAERERAVVAVATLNIVEVLTDETTGFVAVLTIAPVPRR